MDKVQAVMSSLVETIKKRASATEEANAVLTELKHRGVLLVNAIDTTPDLTEEDKEGLAVILGGVATMVETIELGVQFEGSAIELEERGLLQQARDTVKSIDDLLKD